MVSPLESQLVDHGLEFAFGLLLFIAGNRIASWISLRDTLRRDVDTHDMEIDRAIAAIHRIEDSKGWRRTTIRVEDTD